MTGAEDRPTGSQPEAPPSLLQSVVGWLRAGYPDGVPDQDYVPLLALMRRRLSDAEITGVADLLLHSGDPHFGDTDIAVLITKLTNELPAESDIARVRDRLTAAGWAEGPDRA